jgi:hypothetical protein
MLRIFYSWNSDRPADVHRTRLYQALVEAVRQAANRLRRPMSRLRCSSAALSDGFRRS